MESRSFPSSFDIARRYAKHWKQYYLRYGEQGVFVSTLTGQMQDVPQFTTGLPMVDNWSQISQAAMTSVDFFSSIAPQTNVQPVNNVDNEKK